jgi:hypothetical protein
MSQMINRTSTLSVAHRILFGASIVMFLISVAHLGLVMQQVSVDEIPLANCQVQIVISSLQVCPVDSNDIQLLCLITLPLVHYRRSNFDMEVHIFELLTRTSITNGLNF